MNAGHVWSSSVFCDQILRFLSVDLLSLFSGIRPTSQSLLTIITLIITAGLEAEPNTELYPQPSFLSFHLFKIAVD